MRIKAWHFVGDTLRDGSPIPADGETLVHLGPIVPCQSGLHASVRLIDALQYAPGPTLCRVACSGEIKHDGDKFAATSRTILWRMDATKVLSLFARQCALSLAPLWDMPAVVRQYLETGDEALREAAWAGAWLASSAITTYVVSAAVSAAASAASAAASAAAAWDASERAASAIASDAANAVGVWDAASTAARAAEAHNIQLLALVAAHAPQGATI